MRMLWDARKRRTNLETHGLDFADARERFEWETALVAAAHPGEDGRARYQAIGYLDGRRVSLVFSPLGTEAISAISLRIASQSERTRYDDAIEE